MDEPRLSSISPTTKRIVVPEGELDRAWVAVALSIPKLPEHLRGQVANLLRWEVFAVIGATIGAVAVAHYINPVLGVAIDVVAASVAIGMLGTEAIDIAKSFSLFWRTARGARSAEELDRAAVQFASAITRVGVNTLMVLVARKTFRNASVAGLRARYGQLIEALNLKTPPHHGALYSRIPEDLARQVAAKRQRVTLNLTDGYKAFKAAYDAEFGSRQDRLTYELWEKLSRQFAQSLEGTVEAYTDLSKFQKAVRSADLTKPSAVPALPVLTAELDEISDLMLSNDKITFVKLIDIRTMEVVHVLERASVLRATGNAARQHSGQVRLWH